MATDRMVFLSTAEFEDGQVLRGGALVTDISTEPFEFRCTSPVRPTTLQRILWGARLSAHIRANLIGTPLLRSLQQKYGLVVVTEHEFLELREAFDVPLVIVSAHEGIDFEDADDSDGDDMSYHKRHEEPSPD
ncbi:MAG TPA: hypothetical protein VFJ30_10035, partial [Phycisphaerae bacterium]|nr:hypothetical protein [Phycisphaerae bacterium]